MNFQFVVSNALILSAFMVAGAIALSFTTPMVMTFVSKNYHEEIMGGLGGLLTMASHFGTLAGLAIASCSINIKGNYSIALALICLGGALGFLSASFLRGEGTCLK
jgi:MFS family permease